mgnify:FL=1
MVYQTYGLALQYKAKKKVTHMISGSLYYMLLVHNFSKKMLVYFLQEKAKAFSNFKRWHKSVERESGKLVKELPSDWGGEFLSEEFCEYFNEYGIKRQLTATYSPQQMTLSNVGTGL